MYPDRVGYLIVALDGKDWTTYEAIRPPFATAVRSKQLIGTLESLVNRGLVEKRKRHLESGVCVVEWRLRAEASRALPVVR